MKAKKTVCIYWLILVVVFGCIIGARSTEIKVEAAERTVRFWDNSGNYLQKSGGNWYLKDSNKRKLTGLRYLSIPKTEFLKTGFYMFDKNGKLLRKQSVYYFDKKTVSGVRFDKYHITDSNARISKGERGFVNIAEQKVRGKKIIAGIYYVEAYGKLADRGTVRYIRQRRFGGRNFKGGYYYFYGTGRICMCPSFHKVNKTVQGKKFNGIYYFGNDNGRMVQKAGWVTCEGQQYYVDQNGKMLVNRWKDGYYLKSNGTIAKNMKTPDGQYVDWQGRKSTRSEYALSAFKSELESFVSAYGGDWSVYIKDLKTGNVVNINDREMYPASTIKAFVMASVYDQLRQGKMQYSSGVYSLLWDMITVSDNECYNELVRRQGGGSFVGGTAVVNQYLRKNGYKNTGCHSSLHPSSSAWSSDGWRNTASAKDCGILLEKIYRGQCVSQQYSREMLNLLLHQTKRYKIPSGLPTGIVCANKTGETSSVQHDMAIVYGKKTNYVLCIFSEGASEDHLLYGIRSISSRVYQYLNK